MQNIKTTFRQLTIGLVAVAGIALVAATVAKAGEQDFTVHNSTGVEIHKLFVSPHSMDEWGEDILGQDTLSNGDSLDIKFGRHEKAAHWDLRVEDSKGNSLTWESLDLLEISEVTLHYKDGKAWADIK
jgi:hypothetical protein